MGCCQMLFTCCKKKDQIPVDPETRDKKKKSKSRRTPRHRRINTNNHDILAINQNYQAVNSPSNNRQDNGQQLELQCIHVQKTTEAFKIESAFPISTIVHSDKAKVDAKELKYNCPICMDYFSTILTLSCCGNYLCRLCAENYISTTIKYMTKIRCPLCNADENIILSDVDPKKKVKGVSKS